MTEQLVMRVDERLANEEFFSVVVSPLSFLLAFILLVDTYLRGALSDLGFGVIGGGISWTIGRMDGWTSGWMDRLFLADAAVFSLLVGRNLSLRNTDQYFDRAT
jgi:hypothetical protein